MTQHCHRLHCRARSSADTPAAQVSFIASMRRPLQVSEHIFPKAFPDGIDL